MSEFKSSVSIQPYFTVQEGKMDEARQVLDRCVEARLDRIEQELGEIRRLMESSRENGP